MKNLAPQEKSKIELITKLKGLIRDAKNLSFEERCKTGDYNDNPNLKYPQTESERIVAETLGLLLDQDWVDDDPLLDEITSVLGQLDISVNQPQVWQELFQLMSELPDKR